MAVGGVPIDDATPGCDPRWAVVEGARRGQPEDDVEDLTRTTSRTSPSARSACQLEHRCCLIMGKEAGVASRGTRRTSSPPNRGSDLMSVRLTGDVRKSISTAAKYVAWAAALSSSHCLSESQAHTGRWCGRIPIRRARCRGHLRLPRDRPAGRLRSPPSRGSVGRSTRLGTSGRSLIHSAIGYVVGFALISHAPRVAGVTAPPWVSFTPPPSFALDPGQSEARHRHGLQGLPQQFVSRPESPSPGRGTRRMTALVNCLMANSR